MYQFERNSRTYLKGEDDAACVSPTRKSALSSRPSSRSPLQEMNKTSSHHRSSQAIHTNGKDCNGATPHHSQTRTLKDTQQRAVSSELGDLTAPGETRTKTQMARAFQETQELYKSADSKSGLQTVKTRRVHKKTTTITRGENEKVSVLICDSRTACSLVHFVFVFGSFCFLFITRQKLARANTTIASNQLVVAYINR